MEFLDQEVRQGRGDAHGVAVHAPTTLQPTGVGGPLRPPYRPPKRRLGWAYGGPRPWAAGPGPGVQFSQKALSSNWKCICFQKNASKSDFKHIERVFFCEGVAGNIFHTMGSHSQDFEKSAFWVSGRPCYPLVCYQAGDLQPRKIFFVGKKLCVTPFYPQPSGLG